MTGSRILVGVNDTIGARSALNWAAAECQLRDGSLLLVHVPPPHDSVFAELAAGAADLAGSLLLDELGWQTRIRHPELPVKVLLGHGDPAGTLTDLSAMNDLAVLGTTGAGGNLLSLIGSVSARVAAQAHCPVVVVPEQPAMNPARSDQDTIVVGVSDTAAGMAAIRFAFDEASRRGTSVTAVRAWHIDAPTHVAASETDQLEVVDPPSPADSPPPAVEHQLEAELASFRQQYPNVRVLPLLVPAPPADAILQAARTAVLVVIGAHHSENRWSSRLGPVPHTILHHTDCPVVLVGTPQPVAASRVRSACRLGQDFGL